MGMLLAALAGAGDAGVQSMNQNIDQMNKSDLLKQQSDLEEQKQKRIADYAMEIQNRQREKEAGEIRAGAGKLAEERVAKAQGIINTNAQEANELFPPEMSSTGTEGAIPKKLSASPTRQDTIDAAIDRGYIAPKDVMANMTREDTAALRAEMMNYKTDMWKQISDARNDKDRDTAMMKFIAAINKSSKDPADKWQFALKSLNDDITQFSRKAAVLDSIVNGKNGIPSTASDEEKSAAKSSLSVLNNNIKAARAGKIKIASEAGYDLPEYGDEDAPAVVSPNANTPPAKSFWK